MKPGGHGGKDPQKPQKHVSESSVETADGEHAAEAENHPSRSWSDMGPRLISASVLLLITVLMVWAGGIWFALLVSIVFAGGLREWEAMIGARQNRPFGIFLIALMALVPVIASVAGLLFGIFLGVAGSVISLFGRAEFRVWRAAGFLFFSAVVLALLLIRGIDSWGFDSSGFAVFDFASWGVVGWGFAACFFLGATVWMTDTGALLAGRHFRGAKLNPGISPAKTWSGAIGGLLSGTLSGLLVWFFVSPSPWWIGMLIAASVSIFGQVGDLAESAVKRHFRVKDSGDAIPGHGGLLDRIDSLTFGALLVFAIGALNSGSRFVAQGLFIW